jgi:hypothetical protein
MYTDPGTGFPYVHFAADCTDGGSASIANIRLSQQSECNGCFVVAFERCGGCGFGA